jgi:hypothetical protein
MKAISLLVIIALLVTCCSKEHKKKEAKIIKNNKIDRLFEVLINEGFDDENVTRIDSIIVNNDTIVSLVLRDSLNNEGLLQISAFVKEIPYIISRQFIERNHLCLSDSNITVRNGTEEEWINLNEEVFSYYHKLFENKIFMSYLDTCEYFKCRKVNSLSIVGFNCKTFSPTNLSRWKIFYEFILLTIDCYKANLNNYSIKNYGVSYERLDIPTKKLLSENYPLHIVVRFDESICPQAIGTPVKTGY